MPEIGNTEGGQRFDYGNLVEGAEKEETKAGLQEALVHAADFYGPSLIGSKKNTSLPAMAAFYRGKATGFRQILDTFGQANLRNKIDTDTQAFLAGGERSPHGAYAGQVQLTYAPDTFKKGLAQLAEYYETVPTLAGEQLERAMNPHSPDHIILKEQQNTLSTLDSFFFHVGQPKLREEAWNRTSRKVYSVAR